MRGRWFDIMMALLVVWFLVSYITGVRADLESGRIPEHTGHEGYPLGW